MSFVDQSFDIVVFGASGFTGSRIARLLSEICAAADAEADSITGNSVSNSWRPTWALAGRSRSKLEAVNQTLASPPDGAILADVRDPDSLVDMVSGAQQTQPSQLASQRQLYCSYQQLNIVALVAASVPAEQSLRRQSCFSAAPRSLHPLSFTLIHSHPLSSTLASSLPLRRASRSPPTATCHPRRAARGSC